MKRPKLEYQPGVAPKRGRPFLDVATVRVGGMVLPTTAALIEDIQEREGCTVGQAIDKLAMSSGLVLKKRAAANQAHDSTAD